MAKKHRKSEAPGGNGGGMLGTVERLMENRYLHSVRHGFTLAMPIMIVGSIAILVNNFPLARYQEMMGRIWGGNWKSFGSMIYSGTFSIISLVVCLTISYRLAIWYNDSRGMGAPPILAQIAGFCSVMITISVPDGGADLNDMTGVNGLFLTIVITILSAEIFLRLYSFSRRLSAEVYTGEAGDSVPSAMTAILPALATLAVFAAARLLLGLAGVHNINAGLNRLIQMPFEYMRNTAFTAIFFSFSTHFMWLFGIHGNNVLDNVAQNLYTSAMNENIAAVAAGGAAPNIFTKTFFDAFVYTGGAGATLCLIIAVFLFGKRGGTRRLAKISAPFGLFNINEPLMYGIPIVLNPVYVLPFLLAPIANTITSAVSMMLGLVPYTVRETEWTTVIFANAYLSTGGSVAAIALQVFNLVMGVCIYAPFVRLGDRLENRRFANTVMKLSDYAQNYSPWQDKRLTGLGGDVGTVARLLGSDLSSRSDFGLGDEITLFYQPIVDASAGKVFGYESLLRWRHPVHGPISPVVAVSLAEDTGTIGRLGLWVLDTGLRQLAGFRKRGLTGLIQYTNISVKQLADPDFASNVEKLLKKNGIPVEFLRLEVTESVALSMSAEVRDNIDSLGRIGVQLALDDFGMGHSSLTYLQVFPSSTLKIDESLTNNVEGPNSTGLGLVKSMVSICEDMGINLIAERVETKEQLDALTSVGCRLIQGFYYSKPLPAAEFEEFVRAMGE